VKLVEVKLQELSTRFTYSKVSMSLIQIVTGDFFDHYIKKGNILLISEGRHQIDNRYYIKDGILKLELDRSTYQRCGLVGAPVRSAGRVHVKSRYLVERDLRQASMVKGKKAFDRLIWAFSRVLTDSVSWLFIDLQQGEKGGNLNKFTIFVFHSNGRYRTDRSVFSHYVEIRSDEDDELLFCISICPIATVSTRATVPGTTPRMDRPCSDQIITNTEI
jgi:hypothetical protein